MDADKDEEFNIRNSQMIRRTTMMQRLQEKQEIQISSKERQEEMFQLCFARRLTSRKGGYVLDSCKDVDGVPIQYFLEREAGLAYVCLTGQG